MADQTEVQVLKIAITRHEVAIDPPIPVFHVAMGNDRESWEESFGTEVELRAFLRGIKAGCSVFGGRFLDEPEIPETITSVLREIHDSNWSGE